MGKSKEDDINDAFPEECLYSLKEIIEPKIPWFVDVANYLVAKILPKGLSYQQTKKFFSSLKDYL